MRSTATLAERIVALLAVEPMEDADLAARLGVRHQAVNSTCRGLERNGRLVRQIGDNGRIVNLLTETVVEASPVAAPAARSSVAASSALVTEDHVKQAVHDYLAARGWSVRVMWGRERGIDIEAHRGTERFVIEAKGEAPTDQMGGNYFLGMLGELLQRMTDEGARYAIALPETRRYRGLVDRFPALARRRLGLAVFWVRDGVVRLETD
jgi:hypothetical protein